MNLLKKITWFHIRGWCKDAGGDAALSVICIFLGFVVGVMLFSTSNEGKDTTFNIPGIVLMMYMGYFVIWGIPIVFRTLSRWSKPENQGKPKRDNLTYNEEIEDAVDGWLMDDGELRLPDSNNR